MKKVIKFKGHTNHFISSINCVCSIKIFSSSILFYMLIIILRNSITYKYIYIHTHFAKQWSYVEFTLFCNKSTLKTTYDWGDIELKLFSSLKLNKNPKYEKRKKKKKLFKVCHIKIFQTYKVSNYTLGILGKLSMHRGAHWFCDISLEEKLSFATNFCN
jgi:hypothetical protein